MSIAPERYVFGVIVPDEDNSLEDLQAEVAANPVGTRINAGAANAMTIVDSYLTDTVVDGAPIGSWACGVVFDRDEDYRAFMARPT